MFISPGDNVDLTCHVAGQRFPDIRWFKGNELVKIFKIKYLNRYIFSKIKGNSSSS